MTYSTEELLSFGPSIAQAWLHSAFVVNFIATTAYSGPMEYAADDILEGLGYGFTSLLVTPDVTGGYTTNPSGDAFVACRDRRLSPTNIEW